MRTKIFLFALFIFLYISPSAFADNKTSATSASLMKPQVVGRDNREKILESYLSKYDSPLSQYAHVFVNQADSYNIDWKLLVAISGVESTFGRQIPSFSYNAWGWGIYGTHQINFASFADGIATISKGIREQYINQWGAKTVYDIGRLYAASPTWAQRVVYFMEKIENEENSSSAARLKLSL